MRRCALNFVNLIFFGILLVGSVGFSETPFSVSAPLSASQAFSESDPNSQDTNPLVARLKQDAVTLWLRQYLGNRSSQFEKWVTPKLAETYILDYKLSQKGANKDVVELSGHLDTESLKGWIRLIETKGKGSNQLKPLLVISESLPRSGGTDADAQSQQRQSVVAEEALNLLSREMKKLNLKPTLAAGSFSSNPPRSEKDVAQLRMALGQQSGNPVIWLFLNQCRTCELPRADIYLYSMERSGLVASMSEELTVSLRQLDNAEKVRVALEPLVRQFQQDLEKAISEGKLTALPLTITIEGIESYLAYRKLDYSLSKQSYLSDWTPKAFVQSTAQFEALSYLDSEEVARRIESLNPQDLKLSRVRVDSRNIVMRYSP